MTLGEGKPKGHSHEPGKGKETRAVRGTLQVEAQSTGGCGDDDECWPVLLPEEPKYCGPHTSLQVCQRGTGKSQTVVSPC